MSSPPATAPAPPGSVVAGFAGYRRLRRRIESAARTGLHTLLFRPRSEPGSAFVDFGGYDYLGLARHPEVHNAAKAAIDRYGTSVSASRIVAGQIGLHAELERRLAAFLGAEDCLVFVSGYLTNVTVIDHLFGKPDLIVHDDAAHNSILTGCRLSGAEVVGYPCQDWEALDRLVAPRRPGRRRGLLAAEGIYSMDGVILDLAQAVAAKRRHDLLLMVDEAHSLGVLGRAGRGIVERSGLPPGSIDIRMGTLSKSLASCGGYIAGDRGLIEYLRYLAPGFIFSVGLSPPDAAAALAALMVLERESWRVEALRAGVAHFRHAAREHELAVTGDDEAPVASLIVGDPERSMELARRLLAHGIQVPPVLPPAVAAGSARLRFFLTHAHTKAQIDSTVRQVARTMAELKREHGQLEPA